MGWRRLAVGPFLASALIRSLGPKQIQSITGAARVGRAISLAKRRNSPARWRGLCANGPPPQRSEDDGSEASSECDTIEASSDRGAEDRMLAFCPDEHP